MRLNIIAMIAVAFTIVALFLPWLSLGHMTMMDCIVIDSISFSPFQDGWNRIVMNVSTHSVVKNWGTSTWQPKPYFPQSDWFLRQTPEFFMFLTTLLYLFAIGLMIQTSFVTDLWSKAGTRVSIAASNMLFMSIFLYSVLVGWTSKEIAFSGNSVFYLDLGFWLAIFGASLAFASWLHPKFITLNIQSSSRVANTFKRWRPVTDFEKVAVMTVASFLAVYVFAIIYVTIP